MADHGPDDDAQVAVHSGLRQSGVLIFQDSCGHRGRRGGQAPFSFARLGTSTGSVGEYGLRPTKLKK
jgi:hypothetical protein